MLTRLTASALAVILALGLALPVSAQTQEGDQALVDTASEPDIADVVVVEATGDDLTPPDPLPAAVFLRIEYDEGTLAGGDSDARMLDLYEFYDGRFYEPIWVTEAGATEKARTVAAMLLAAQDHGLNASDYGAAIISSLIRSRSPQGLADLEIRLSKATLDFGRDLSAGRVEPSAIENDIAVFPQGPSASDLLLGVIGAEDVSAYLGAIAPRSDNYQRLKTTLAAYRGIAVLGGWSRVPAGEVLKPEMTQARVVNLGTRLIDAGLLEPADLPQADNPQYKGAVVDAVKVFQQRHGLEVDGIVGPGTLAALNTSIEERIATMELNMERRRWMEDNLGSSYVFVNLADYQMKLVHGEKTVHTARVVVGKPYHRTPVFSKKMTYVVLNPYWHVPQSIARKELLPELIANPGALKAKNIRVLNGFGENAPEIDPWSVNWSAYRGRSFPFKVRQDPGNKNALGRVKFMFPNKFNVYLHDTPSKSLFNRTVRSFSHGCIRVQNPIDLAEIILGSEAGWSPERIQSALNEGRKRIVKLNNPLPVHITYLTAWVNKDGSVHFRDDIYGRDKALAEALHRSRFLVN